MNPDKLTKIVLALHDGTQKGKIKWRTPTDSDEGIYYTEVGGKSIVFSTRHSVEFGEDEVDYVIAIYKEQTKLIDSITDIDLRSHIDEAYKFMADFYRDVRRKALGIDDALDSILGDLDKIL